MNKSVPEVRKKNLLDKLCWDNIPPMVFDEVISCEELSRHHELMVYLHSWVIKTIEESI